MKPLDEMIEAVIRDGYRAKPEDVKRMIDEITRLRWLELDAADARRA